MRLRKRGHYKDSEEDVCGTVRKLVVACKCDLDCNAKGFHAHHRHGADERADAHVDERVGACITRGEAVDGVEGVAGDEEEVYYKHFFVHKSIRMKERPAFFFLPVEKLTRFGG